MKLYELQVGQRFEFEDKLPGITFEIIKREPREITYMDVSTGESRTAKKGLKMFRKDVDLVTKEKTITLNDGELSLLHELLHEAYQLSSERGEPEHRRTSINGIFKKIK